MSAQIELTYVGKIIQEVYINLEKEFKNIKLHNYIIMPNHIHGIIENKGRNHAPLQIYINKFKKLKDNEIKKDLIETFMLFLNIV